MSAAWDLPVAFRDGPPTLLIRIPWRLASVSPCLTSIKSNRLPHFELEFAALHRLANRTLSCPFVEKLTRQPGAPSSATWTAPSRYTTAISASPVTITGWEKR